MSDTFHNNKKVKQKFLPLTPQPIPVLPIFYCPSWQNLPKELFEFTVLTCTYTPLPSLLCILALGFHPHSATEMALITINNLHTIQTMLLSLLSSYPTSQQHIIWLTSFSLRPPCSPMPAQPSSYLPAAPPHSALLSPPQTETLGSLRPPSIVFSGDLTRVGFKHHSCRYFLQAE